METKTATTSKTQIKYKKNSCCYCDEWFDNAEKFKVSEFLSNKVSHYRSAVERMY